MTSKMVDAIIQENRDSTPYLVVETLFKIIIAQLVALLVYKSVLSPERPLLQLSLLPTTLSFLFLSFNLFHYFRKVVILVEDHTIGELFSVILAVAYVGAILLAFQYVDFWIMILGVLIFIVFLKNAQLWFFLDKHHPLRAEFWKWSAWSLGYVGLVAFFFGMLRINLEEVPGIPPVFADRFKLFINWFFSVLVVFQCLKNWRKIDFDTIQTYKQRIEAYLKTETCQESTT